MLCSSAIYFVRKQPRRQLLAQSCRGRHPTGTESIEGKLHAEIRAFVLGFHDREVIEQRAQAVALTGSSAHS
jgi:hypothetical protein